MIVPFETRNVWNQIFGDLDNQKKFKNVLINFKEDQYKSLQGGITKIEEIYKKFNIIDLIDNSFISCFDYYTRNYGKKDYNDKFGYDEEYDGKIEKYSLKEKVFKRLPYYTEEFMNLIEDDAKQYRKDKMNSLIYFQILRVWFALSYIGVTPNQALEILVCLLNMRQYYAGKNTIKGGIKEISVPERYICRCAGVRLNREQLYGTFRQLQRTGLLNLRWSESTGRWMVSLNWDLLLEDELIAKKCKKTFKSNIKILEKCTEDYGSVHMVGHTYQYNMDYKKEILLGLAFVYTYYGFNTLYNVSGFERGETGDRINEEVTYIEIPFHIAANILNEREDELVRYMHNVCKSCDYISVKNKTYITEDGQYEHHRLHEKDKEWQYQNTLVNYKDAVIDDVKHKINQGKTTLNATKKLFIKQKVNKEFSTELSDNHPLTSDATFIIHNDKFFKTKLSKRILENFEELKNMLILQIIELIMDWYSLMPTKKDKRILPSNYYISNSKVESPEYFHLITDIQRNRKGKLTGLVEKDIFIKNQSINENNELVTIKIGTKHNIDVTQTRKLATIHVLKNLLETTVLDTPEQIDEKEELDNDTKIAKYFIKDGTIFLNLSKLKTEKRHQDYNSKPVRLKFSVKSIPNMNHKTCIKHIKEIIKAIEEDCIYELGYYINIFNKLVDHLNLLKHISITFKDYIKNLIEYDKDTNEYVLLRQLNFI